MKIKISRRFRILKLPHENRNHPMKISNINEPAKCCAAVNKPSARFCRFYPPCFLMVLSLHGTLQAHSEYSSRCF